ncbi:isochorismate synthase [Sinomicrobium sp. FJxs]|uniref:isochorismate synthase n=2 Tax=Sinomicrobium weinanense TaxID=2842200 RepID=A0A926JU15_9FLAO|nr:isochorismate synthase [Sinomicrobium weinanense]MBU3122381.1 isochorismate synthase [Sinomicrobium weinanense]
MISEEDFFEQIREQYASGLPFVAYRKPGNSPASHESTSLTKAVLQQDDALHPVKDFSEKGFVFSPFNQNEKAVLIPCPTEGKGTVVLLSRFQRKKTDTEEKNGQGTPSGRETENTDRGKHMDLVQKGIETIRKGKLEKVVLSRKEEVPVTLCEPVAIFQKLLERYEDAFCYIWFHPKVGLWLGATPETLLRIRGCVLYTMALAGTQKYTGQTRVFWGEKEKQEQQVVTDSIVDSLRFKVKSLKISGAGTHRAGNLLHIRTDIQATLIPEYKTKNIAPLLKSLHPTPAVCGFPKDEARLFILENEGYDRSFYTGFLGELNTDISGQQDGNTENRDSELYVNLRCMQMNGNIATLYVGGGITRDSDPGSEWEETVNKSFTMKKILD